jgi:hypothetical protein
VGFIFYSPQGYRTLGQHYSHGPQHSVNGTREGVIKIVWHPTKRCKYGDADVGGTRWIKLEHL